MLLSNDLSIRVRLNKEAFEQSSVRCKILAEAVVLNCKERNFEAAERLSLTLSLDAYS